jgi:hypothetical protein
MTIEAWASNSKAGIDYTIAAFTAIGDIKDFGEQMKDLAG